MVRRALIGVGILALIGGVGLFVLDQTIFAPVDVRSELPVAPMLTVQAPTQPVVPAGSDAPTEPSAEVPAESGAGASDTRAVLYRIDAAQSEVRYEVGETLFNQNNRFQVAVGRTQGIAGDILVDFAQPSSSQIGAIVIDVSQFASDEPRRDNYIRRNGLQSSRYPMATFQPTSIDGLPPSVSIGDQVTFTILGDLTVKETTRPVAWEVRLTLEEDRLAGSASTEILMSDFGVGPIQIFTLATEDLVKLYLDFVAVPVEG